MGRESPRDSRRRQDVGERQDEAPAEEWEERMSERNTEINQTISQLRRLEPEFCANCGRDLDECKDVKEVNPRHERMIRALRGGLCNRS